MNRASKNHKRMSDQNHFMASLNLENTKEGDVKATSTLKGLPGQGESEATFASKYRGENGATRG
jgi:hypothetical protein